MSTSVNSQLFVTAKLNVFDFLKIRVNLPDVKAESDILNIFILNFVILLYTPRFAFIITDQNNIYKINNKIIKRTKLLYKNYEI